MATSLSNVSFDGSPVHFRLDSPLLVCFDPVALDMLHDQLASVSAHASLDIGQLLERVNVRYPAVSCYHVPAFRPGLYTLDPRDIQKFGDEDDDLDYNEAQEDERETGDHEASFPFVAVDSGTLVFADFAHLSRLVALLSWEQYNLGLQDEAVFGRITDALGGPFFALIMAGGMAGMEFDGDGIYTIQVARVTPSAN
jgi:hypothetical protein